MICLIHVYQVQDGGKIANRGGWIDGSPVEGQPIVLTDGTTWIVRIITDTRDSFPTGGARL